MTEKLAQKVPTEQDFSLFHKGDCTDAYTFMGAHQIADSEYVFRVWAPNAKTVSVVGDFNHWDRTCHPMTRITDGGIWELTVCGLSVFSLYKYSLETQTGEIKLKSDPYGFHFETRPGTATKLYDLEGFHWTDHSYLKKLKHKNPLEQPINIYELHPGSWRKFADGEPFNYQKLATELIAYVKEMGYTHIELMPISEYPYDGSWGYQVTGYYAPTSRYGTPTDFMQFIDDCHAAGIGVILDWVAAHFPKDAVGLYEFDGTCCYEYADPLKNEHPDWGTRIFDYERGEVQSFLISNVLFFLKLYHVDGIRVDAVASMLYLDYGKKDGQWRPNAYGGKENLGAVSFLQKLNRAAFRQNPSVLMIAEESTAWPMVTKPTDQGGLGFLLKWNMGWMNDMLSYMSKDPFFRKNAHNQITFSMTYAFSENYILPLSHDEVVHGKCSLINKMPGVYEQKFANLRAFLAYQIAHPGKKLLFMGGEFAQFIEWDYHKELDWLLLGYDYHKKFQACIKELNRIYRIKPQLWQIDDSWDGFTWIVPDDHTQNILAFIRRDKKGRELLCIFNFSPILRENYRLGLPQHSRIRCILSTDDTAFGGEGTRLRGSSSKPIPSHGFAHSLTVTVAPMSAAFYEIKHLQEKGDE
ncbi:MAG: 1,4-alpha-glucan branching protein GlgB [Clostridia bacterium]|nr:1,4-alpha-glucan branching protein GlgB [Clostridia bacterium]